VNAKTMHKWTPLDLAIHGNKPETAELLRKHGGKNGMIHGAAMSGDTELIKEFLAAGVNVNARSYVGRYREKHHWIWPTRQTKRKRPTSSANTAGNWPRTSLRSQAF